MADSFEEGVLESARVSASRKEEVDVVIVGTGCGGAVMAAKLAQAGKSVLMVERGGFYLPRRGDFDQREDDMFARIDGGRGLHSSENGHAALTYGRCVGGASVHYWADTLRAPADRLEKWARDFGVEGHSEEELRPHFEQVERAVHAHPAAVAKRNVMNQLFVAGAEGAGIGWEAVVQARDERCVDSGYCMQGCAYDGKQSQLVTFLPQVVKAGGRIVADCEVERVLLEGGRATGVLGHFLDRSTLARTGHTLEVRAKVVVVAAGGLNSAPLLLRSGVPDPSGQLGKNLQLNPCPQMFGVFDRDVTMWHGIPAAVGAMGYRLHTFDHGRYVEGGYLLYPNQLPPATLAALLPGFGAAHQRLMDDAHRIGSTIAWLDDLGSGSARLDPDGNPVWEWTLSKADELVARDAMKKEALVLLHAGAHEVITPDPVGTRIADTRELKKLDSVDVRPGSMMFASPHPAGMCRMGKDPRTSVVGSNNEVHAVRGLYVCDSSAFPTVVSVDPSDTIMAFSSIAADRLLRDWGRS